MGYLRDRVSGRRMPAAVADHGGGESSRRGMVKSKGGEIATLNQEEGKRAETGIHSGSVPRNQPCVRVSTSEVGIRSGFRPFYGYCSLLPMVGALRTSSRFPMLF